MKSSNNRKPNRKTNKKSDGASLFDMKSSALGLLITLAIGITLLILGSLIAYKSADPSSLITPIGYVSPFLTAILGGFACTKLNKRDPLPCSVLCGGYFVLLSMLASCALPQTLSSTMTVWIRLLIHGAIFLCFPIGAILGIKAKSNRPKPHKRK